MAIANSLGCRAAREGGRSVGEVSWKISAVGARSDGSADRGPTDAGGTAGDVLDAWEATVEFRLTAVDFDVRTGSWRAPVAVMTARLGDSVLVGREGDLPVAIDPIDPGVSRRALTVTVDPAHWELGVTNTNHAWIHPWGQRPTWVEANRTVRQSWPRIGVLLVGNREDLHHWVLLESDTDPSEWRKRPVDPAPAPAGPAGTQVKGAAGGLTGAQLEAVQMVFAKHLAWPPVIASEPMLLEAAARKLRIVPNAVTDRLKQAQSRAYALGPHRQTGVMNPEFVYVLAGAGYLPVPEPFNRVPNRGS